jgi:choline dehydrogenase
MPTYDILVVGAGSAGAVLATRLAEHPGRSVLLLEAGASYERLQDLPPEVLEPSRSVGTPGHPANWGMLGTLLPDLTVPVSVGKIIGGSSSVNGTYFIRGRREDFASWAGQGLDQWSFEQVLPYFRRSESDLDFPGGLHGSAGPITVRREPVDRAPALTEAFAEACALRGHPVEADKNGDQPPGVGPVPLNIGNQVRMSTAVSYLIPNMSRPNLRIIGGAFVRRVVIERGRAVAVEADVAGRRMVFGAAEIIVSAGALRSPHVLMLSGIGPAAELRRHGIPVAVDLPGVGRGLMDHPELLVNYVLGQAAPELPGRGAMPVVLHWSSGFDSGAGDLEIMPMTRTARAMLGRTSTLARRPLRLLAGLRGTSLRAVRAQAWPRGTGSVVLGLLQERSRGQILLRSPDASEDPLVQYCFLAEGSDQRRFREAVRVAAELFGSKPFAKAGGRLLDLDRADLVSDASVDAWVRRHLMIAAHPSSTCRMGPDNDPMAVVDQFGRVRGLEGLRVADASIWPSVPSRGPNATAVMTGERVAAFVDPTLAAVDLLS